MEYLTAWKSKAGAEALWGRGQSKGPGPSRSSSGSTTGQVIVRSKLNTPNN